VEFCGQGCENTLQVGKHVVIPEAHNPKLVFRKPPVTLNVSGRLGVLTAIHFHNQSRFKAKKIRYIRPNWYLTPKLERLKPAASQGEPELSLSIGHLRPQFASSLRQKSSPLTRLAPLALGTLSRKGRWRNPRRRHRAPSISLRATISRMISLVPSKI
jgi:hypothetical protein